MAIAVLMSSMAVFPVEYSYADSLRDAIDEARRSGSNNQTPPAPAQLSPKLAECKSINDVISQPLSANLNISTVSELIVAQEGQISILQTLNLQDDQLKSIQAGYVDVFRDMLDVFKTSLNRDFGQRAVQEPQFAFKLSTLPTRQYELKKQLEIHCKDIPVDKVPKAANNAECNILRSILDAPSISLKGDNPRAIQSALLSSEEGRLNQLQAINLQDVQLKDIQTSYIEVLSEVVSALHTASAPNPAVQAKQEGLLQEMNDYCPSSATTR